MPENHQKSTAATVWNWYGKTLSPGALLTVLHFSSCHIFPPVQTFPRPHYLPLGLRGCFAECLTIFPSKAFKSTTLAKNYGFPGSKLCSLRPRPHVSGDFCIRKFFYADTKISASTRSVYESYTTVHKYPIRIRTSQRISQQSMPPFWKISRGKRLVLIL